MQARLGRGALLVLVATVGVGQCQHGDDHQAQNGRPGPLQDRDVPLAAVAGDRVGAVQGDVLGAQTVTGDPVAGERCAGGVLGVDADANSVVADAVVREGVVARLGRHQAVTGVAGDGVARDGVAGAVLVHHDAVLAVVARDRIGDGAAGDVVREDDAVRAVVFGSHAVDGQVGAVGVRIEAVQFVVAEGRAAEDQVLASSGVDADEAVVERCVDGLAGGVLFPADAVAGVPVPAEVGESAVVGVEDGVVGGHHERLVAAGVFGVAGDRADGNAVEDERTAVRADEHTGLVEHPELAHVRRAERETRAFGGDERSLERELARAGLVEPRRVLQHELQASHVADFAFDAADRLARRQQVDVVGVDDDGAHFGGGRCGAGLDFGCGGVRRQAHLGQRDRVVGGDVLVARDVLECAVVLRVNARRQRDQQAEGAQDDRHEDDHSPVSPAAVVRRRARGSVRTHARTFQC